ncbi:MAG: FtsW/RodA/SpoVE family cell cycle protein [Prevotella sp.]|nr:FtsW/RodA/SpoVE family cell cycle protein [Prevotella sp.]MDD3387849.1 FtsW/RodA/SpoVE family cell cycle protein [Prevotella sp.]
MNRKLNNIFKGDKVIWMVFFFLCLISVVEVFSASSGLTYKSGSYLAPIVKHILILMVGVFFMVVTLNIKCRYFKLLTPFLLILSIVSLIWVYFAGQETNDAQRWVTILGVQFQPSEIAKGTMVLATAQILSAMQTNDGADRHAMNYILAVCLVIVPLIMMENLSTAALLCVVVFLMMVVGRVPAQQLGKLLGAVMLLIVSVITMVMVFGHDVKEEDPTKTLSEQVSADGAKEKVDQKSGIFHRFDTWKSRIDKFLNSKEVAPEDVDLDKDAQVAHANIAIASSNIIGKGPGNSVERDFLSQAFSDFIYAIIIEEMGMFGAFFVAMLYIILLFRTGRIANRCENNFPAFLAMGLAMLLVTQALFNMCVAVGLAPVTGQPLPLISKGGTSSIINCVYIGVILSVSRSAKKNIVSIEDKDEQTEAQLSI